MSWKLFKQKSIKSNYSQKYCLKSNLSCNHSSTFKHDADSFGNCQRICDAHDSCSVTI